MKSTVEIVKSDEQPWEDFVRDEDYTGKYRVLSKGTKLGVNVECIEPGHVTCPFHWHMKEDEFFLVLKGKAMMRTDDGKIEIVEGDAISCPAGEGSAHQFWNHTDEPTHLLMVGQNRPDEVCYYPDSDKWLLRDLKLHGRVSKADYWDGEPSPPRIKQD